MLRLLTCLAIGSLAAEAQPAPRYTNSFDRAEPGKVPGDMLVLDGGFVVREGGGNKFLELPGTPLNSYSVLFGAAGRDDRVVQARCFGTATGRRYPAFAVGLGGVAGYRLQVSPGKREIELYKGEATKVSAAFSWRDSSWTWLKLEVRRAGEGRWKVEGKAWTEGEPEPPDWLVTFDETEEPKAGRAGVFGVPYAGTPIRFDDLSVQPVADVKP